jgi:hypothetical protein
VQVAPQDVLRVDREGRVELADERGKARQSHVLRALRLGRHPTSVSPNRRGIPKDDDRVTTEPM